MPNLLDGGTINYNNGGFTVVSPNAVTPTNNPGIQFPNSSGGTSAQSYSSSQTNTSMANHVTPLAFPTVGAPPTPPDTSTLTAIQEQVRRKGAIAKAMKDYDDLFAATQASGFQTANNAGNVYANRLIQSGVNPVASGVVRAQAKIPVYQQLAGIETQREQTRLDATNKADTLAASIASTVAGLQSSYAKMLADYNLQSTGYNLDLSKFSATLGEQSRQYDSDYALKAAQVASGLRGRSGSDSRIAGPGEPGFNPLLTPGFNPGYIPDFGPIIGSDINPNLVYIGGGGVR